MKAPPKQKRVYRRWEFSSQLWNLKDDDDSRTSFFLIYTGTTTIAIIKPTSDLMHGYFSSPKIITGTLLSERVLPRGYILIRSWSAAVQFVTIAVRFWSEIGHFLMDFITIIKNCGFDQDLIKYLVRFGLGYLGSNHHIRCTLHSYQKLTVSWSGIDKCLRSWLEPDQLRIRLYFVG